MDVVTLEQHRRDAMRVRELMARYNEVELLVRVGEYQRGNDATADEAVSKIDNINTFLRQSSGESVGFAEVGRQLRELAE